MSKVVKKTKKYALRENGEMWTRDKDGGFFICDDVTPENFMCVIEDHEEEMRVEMQSMMREFM